MRQCRNAAYGYRNPYVSPLRRWLNSWDRAEPSRSDRPVYRRDTGVRPYTQLVKVEQEQSDPLMTISETLGALNTVGNYIVNMTRGVEISNYPPKELPSALYTISKNILGDIRENQYTKLYGECYFHFLCINNELYIKIYKEHEFLILTLSSRPQRNG